MSTRLSPLVEQYGQIIVDEYHHISAPIFEQIARAAKARYIVGFSATVESTNSAVLFRFPLKGLSHQLKVPSRLLADRVTVPCQAASLQMRLEWRVERWTIVRTATVGAQIRGRIPCSREEATRPAALPCRASFPSQPA
jgi:hypothetical protein